MTELFWFGMLFGAIAMIFITVAAVAIYVRVKGAFVIGPPEPIPPRDD
jgi:hypothetical protein